MNFEQERLIIEKRFNELFDSELAPVQYENVAVLKKGSNTIKFTDSVKKFVRFTISPSGGEQRDVGGRADRFSGIITVQILVKAGLGTNLARKIADQVYYIFNRKTFDGVVCQTTEIDVFPNNTDGWYQINVNTPYYRDVEYVEPVKIY